MYPTTSTTARHQGMGDGSEVGDPAVVCPGISTDEANWRHLPHHSSEHGPWGPRPRLIDHSPARERLMLKDEELKRWRNAPKTRVMTLKVPAKRSTEFSSPKGEKTQKDRNDVVQKARLLPLKRKRKDTNDNDDPQDDEGSVTSLPSKIAAPTIAGPESEGSVQLVTTRRSFPRRCTVNINYGEHASSSQEHAIDQDSGSEWELTSVDEDSVSTEEGGMSIEDDEMSPEDDSVSTEEDNIFTEDDMSRK